MKTTPKSRPLLQIHDLNKHFGQTRVLRDISLELHSGEILFLLGASGCGKTTLLRAIAGFEQPDNGEIYLKERLIFGANCNIPPQQRRLGYVVQEGVLFPHLNVYRNIAYGLGDGKGRSPEERQRIDEVMALTGICALADRFPHQLSGGQQQRVALARALVIAPQILLFDEPLSNLDTHLRRTMREMIRHLQQKLGITVLYVTHDQTEAFAVSDAVVVINQGNVEQIGSPNALYHHPTSRFTANFMGEVSFFPVSVKNGNYVLAENALSIKSDVPPPEGNYVLGIRPEGVLLTLTGEPAERCEVQSAISMGSYWEIQVRWHGLPLLVHLNPNDYTPNQPEYFVKLRPIGWFVLAEENF